MYHPISTTEPMMGNSPVYGTDKDPMAKSGVRPLRLEPQRPKCNDAFFGVLFALNVAVIILFSAWKGLDAINSLTPAKASSQDNLHGYGRVFGIFSGLGAMGLVVSILWLKLLLYFAEHMIRVALWMNVGLLIAFAVTSFAVNPFMPLLFLFMAFINVCYIWAVQNRIAFASANLKCACKAISNHRNIVGVAIFIVFVQLLWTLLWTLATLGVYQLFREGDSMCKEEEKDGKLCGGSGMIVAFFFLLFSLYWGQQVIQNVLTCTTAGTVAAWWYQENPGKAVGGALRRSLTTSFGSICFGSLIVAVLQTLSAVARYLREQAQEDNNAGLACLACMAECILNCLESIMEYINQWAYCYVGIYGYDFRTSGKAVMDLFKQRGWTTVINDDLTSSALGFGAFGVALVTAGVGLLIGLLAPETWLRPLTGTAVKFGSLGGVGFIVGLCMALVLVAVIITAIHTVFVCFAEDPIAFGRTHPAEYAELVNAWKQFHPDALVVYGDYI